MWRTAADWLPDATRNVVGICGAALMAYGAWLIYAPAGFIVGGVMLIAGVALSAATAVRR